MAFRLYDGFGRNASTTPAALGVSDSGHTWVNLSSSDSVGVAGNRAYLPTDPALTLAVLDSGPGGGDGTLSCRLTGNGAGLGLYFRVVDADDWWRAYERIYTYTYQTGTETYVSGYQQVYVGTETYISGYTTTEYEWRQNYSVGVTHSWDDMFSLHHALRWSTSSTNAPFFSSSISHAHYLSGSYYPGDQSNHLHNKSGSPFRTGRTRGGDPIYSTRAVYESQPIYSTRPTYGTATAYELRVEKMVLGALTTLSSRQISGPFPSLSVVLDGSKIDAYAGTSSTPVTVTDASHQAATQHGIGVGKPSISLSASSNQIDDFEFNPELLGRYQPPVLL